LLERRAGEDLTREDLRHGADEPGVLNGRNKDLRRNLLPLAIPSSENFKARKLPRANLNHGLKYGVELFVFQSTPQICFGARHA